MCFSASERRTPAAKLEGAASGWDHLPTLPTLIPSHQAAGCARRVSFPQKDFQKTRPATPSILWSKLKASDADCHSAFWKVLTRAPWGQQGMDLLVSPCLAPTVMNSMQGTQRAQPFNEPEDKLGRPSPALPLTLGDIGLVVASRWVSIFPNVKCEKQNRWSCRHFQLLFSLTLWENTKPLQALGGLECQLDKFPCDASSCL